MVGESSADAGDSQIGGLLPLGAVNVEGDDTSLSGLELSGNRPDVLNKAVFFIIGFVVCSSITGMLVDNCVLRKKMKGDPIGRPRGWVVGTLFASYILLLPGWFMTLFAFKIAAMNGLMTLKAKDETMVEFAQELWTSGSAFGFICVVGFAMVIPLVKLALLIVGGITRHSPDDERVTYARRSISFVQKISKWASPDMFAYVLLLYLIRKLNHPPILNGLMELDIGFTCFATFCVASTISSLGVRLPEKKPVKVSRSQRKSHVAAALVVAIVCSVVFTACMFKGLHAPCMALRLDIDLLVKSGQMDASLAQIVSELGLQDIAADDVGLWGCMGEMWTWSFPDTSSEVVQKNYYEFNNVLAFGMFAVFAVALTCLNMLVLAGTAVYFKFQKSRPQVALEAIHVLRKLSMLDVAIVGVVVVILAGKIYRKLGVIMSLKPGLLYLAIAEASHYVLYYTIRMTAKRLPIYVEHGIGDDSSECDSTDDENEERLHEAANCAR